MNYGCQQTAEALAAFALNALDAEERSAVLEHLADCRLHDAELEEHRAVAGRLPLLVDTAAAIPPAGLRENLLAAFDRESTASPVQATAPEPILAPAAEAATPVPQAARPRGGILSILRQPAFAYGIAAALLIAVLGLGIWNVSLQDDEGNVLQAAATAPGMSLEVEYFEDEHVAVLNLEMPPPPEGKVYQAWMIADGKPVSMGVLAGNSGRMAFAADMTGATAIAISQEPAGGSATPTEVKLAAEF